MKYTVTHTYGLLQYTRVLPLDSENVHFSCSVYVPHYRTSLSDPLLALYAATALSGTEKHTKRDIEMLLKKYGITMSVRAQADIVHFTIAVRSVHIAHAVSLLTEILFHPKRRVEELNQKISLFLEENREARDDAKRLALTQFINVLYRDIPRARMLTLDEELAEIRALTPKDILRCEKNILKGEWYVTYVGNEKNEKALMPLLVILGSTAQPVDRTVIIPTEGISTHTFTTVPSKTNVEVRIGNTLSITPKDAQYIPLAFGVAVLGHVGGFSGRLMSTVREKHGLTYGIYATVVEHTIKSTTHWNIFTFFTAKDLAKGLSATLTELKKIVSRGITLEELAIFKEILKNSYILSHDSNKQRLALYHSTALKGESEDDIFREHERVDSLTCEEVNAALRAHITPRTLVISGAGPVDESGTGILD